MPSYPKGTRQWAEAQLLMLETMQAEGYCPSREADIHDLMEELGSLPDGAENGTVFSTTGTWTDNVKAVESALSAELYPDRKHNADYTEAMRKTDRDALELWLCGDKQYMNHSTRNALRRILRGGL